MRIENEGYRKEINRLSGDNKNVLLENDKLKL